MNILSLIESDGYKFKRVASTSGGVYKGACPWCGGDDRFSVYPEKQNGGSYICNQCDNHGDMIQYLRKYRNMSYRAACQQAGIQPEIRHKKLSESVTPSLEKYSLTQSATKKTEIPADTWQSKTTGLVFAYYKHLLSVSGQRQRSYLNSRGLTNETIKKARLGYNTQSATFDRSVFGLPLEMNEKTGKKKNVWIPGGVAIPLFDENEKLLRLRIRQENHDPRFGKYIIIPGSSSQYFIYPDYHKSKPSIVVESELDGWLIWQEAGGLINVFAIGNDSNKPDELVNSLLKQSPRVLICADFDSAGMKAAEFWFKAYSATLWTTPTGKDPSESFISGLNIREWIKAGIDSNIEPASHVIEIGPEEIPAAPSLEMQKIEIEEIPDLDPEEEAEPEKAIPRTECLDNQWCGRLKGSTCLINNINIFDLSICPEKFPRWKKWVDGPIEQIIKMPQPIRRRR